MNSNKPRFTIKVWEERSYTVTADGKAEAIEAFWVRQNATGAGTIVRLEATEVGA